MLLYSAFGFCFSSDHPIPGFAPWSGPANDPIQVVLGSVPPAIGQPDTPSPAVWFVGPNEGPDGKPSLTAWKVGQQAWFRFTNEAELVIDLANRRVWVRWFAPCTLEDALVYLLGPGLGFLLSLHGTTTYAEDAVVVNGRRICPGEALGSGQIDDGGGPGTTRACGAHGRPRRPHQRRAHNPRPAGAFPLAALALFRTSLFGDTEALPPLTPNWDKRFLDLAQPNYQFQDRPVPLAAIYLLGAQHSEADVCVLPLSDAAGLLAVCGNVHHALPKHKVAGLHVPRTRRPPGPGASGAPGPRGRPTRRPLRHPSRRLSGTLPRTRLERDRSRALYQIADYGKMMADRAHQGDYCEAVRTRS